MTSTESTFSPVSKPVYDSSGEALTHRVTVYLGGSTTAPNSPWNTPPPGPKPPDSRPPRFGPDSLSPWTVAFARGCGDYLGTDCGTSAVARVCQAGASWAVKSAQPWIPVSS